ncbi:MULTISPECIES: plasmid replication protein RepC [unclassified Ensifer]|uniref:plasmid replication protein RepC n=1 Tax=unclassified Ensifer TaxID=2633371 RepID=UPI000708D214|nr:MULTISPECIES: plasmid replication protein RepC [unclassified Ensifer]KQW34932.1 replication initiation protein RepC [Ensifer sp. Root1252]KRC57256.1 replication initiation protein RepC [Ensifer sp. Root231]KRC87751.1 replication initiation protein RepC [Ensifer sp. Root258]
MERDAVTTPFGRRAMTLGMLATQVLSRQIEPGQTAGKWKLFQSLCDARLHFGLSERSLLVLNALLTFYPHDEISEENGLVVFPSNSQLARRAHGMAEATLRRHLAALINAGVLVRKDSANGKRYARKDQSGGISEAFGFSVAPLLVRAEEITAIAISVANERQELRRLRERLTICRRDVSKLIVVALEEGAPGDWFAVQERLRVMTQTLVRRPTRQQAEDALEEFEMLREEVTSRLELKFKSKDMSGNADHIDRHLHNSNPHSLSELELGSGNEPKAKSEPTNPREKGEMTIFPIQVVLKACPEIVPYGPYGTISSWRDLMVAAVTVRSMLGVSPSAYQEACEAMGPENAATTLACILERAGHITSAGGYLRDLTAKARGGRFSLGPMIMALMRANGQGMG